MTPLLPTQTDQNNGVSLCHHCYQLKLIRTMEYHYSTSYQLKLIRTTEYHYDTIVTTSNWSEQLSIIMTPLLPPQSDQNNGVSLWHHCYHLKLIRTMEYHYDTTVTTSNWSEQWNIIMAPVTNSNWSEQWSIIMSPLLPPQTDQNNGVSLWHHCYHLKLIRIMVYHYGTTVTNSNWSEQWNIIMAPLLPTQNETF